MSVSLNLNGQKFGYWTVLNKTEKRASNGGVYWHCKCKCGKEKDVLGNSLKSGKSLSCGCLKKEKASIIKNDYTNQIFGKLFVIGLSDKTKKGKIFWKCKCTACGKFIDIRADRLPKATSCGCLSNEKRAFSLSDDLSNQRFGYLIAKEPFFDKIKNKILWKCQCDCGNEYITYPSSLKNGSAKSCGCLGTSIGEDNIKQILNNNNILFEKEKTFETCRFTDTNIKARFDFYLPEKNRLIEFDGRQHYSPEEKGWNTYENFKKLQKRDQEKNQWAKDNNISLVRIPYWERDNITLDMILGDKYLVY